MAPPRPRRRGNRDMPANLYPQKNRSGSVSYRYIRPDTRTSHNLGTDKAEAVAAALVLNRQLGQATNLVAQVLGGSTVREVIARFRNEYLVECHYADSSLKEVNYRLARYERELGDTSWENFDLSMLSEFLKDLSRDAYIKHRGQWVQIFRFTCSVGLSENNLAELTLAKKPAARKRKRWTLEQFNATRAHAEPWLQIAMDLALVSLQRREDLVNMQFNDITDGRLLVTQSKEKKRLAIRISPSLAKIVKAAKAQALHCPYIIARRPDRKVKSAQRKHHFAVTPNYLSKAVAAARDATGLFNDYKEGEHPTLHEIRSLGAHLYREAGFEEGYIQALLGHEDAKMTAHYLDGHKVEYQEVSADLTL